MRLAIVCTHPIQYYSPIFRLLNERKKIEIKVFYTWGEKALNKYDPGFRKQINWDIPLMDGYCYEWVKNTSNTPGSDHFYGIVNPDLIGQIVAWKSDAVLVFGWAYHSHLKVLHHFKNKIPVFFRGDSTLLDQRNGLKSKLRAVLLKWVYKHIDHVFYVGSNNKAYFKKYGVKENQLTFAPHAIDNDRFSIADANDVILLRQKLGIQKDDRLILFAGKLENKKAPLLLLDAFLSLNDPKMHLLFMGNGELEESLKAQAKKSQNVRFLEFQNQSVVPTVYHACDLFCLPSNGPGESWGLAVNEAMACGKALLVSDKVGCAVDLVSENSNGAIFISGNKESLVASLKRLTCSSEKLLEYGENSKTRIKEWNFIRIAEAIEKKLIETTSLSNKI
jgi:glycosyltransferase involved in cell wall biosynthesis